MVERPRASSLEDLKTLRNLNQETTPNVPHSSRRRSCSGVELYLRT